MGGRIVLTFSWIITLIATCFAALGLCFGLAVSNGAPQQAAVAAIAAASVIIPYVFTRAIEGISGSEAKPATDTPSVPAAPTASRSLSELAAQQTGHRSARERAEPSVSLPPARE